MFFYLEIWYNCLWLPKQLIVPIILGNRKFCLQMLICANYLTCELSQNMLQEGEIIFIDILESLRVEELTVHATVECS